MIVNLNRIKSKLYADMFITFTLELSVEQKIIVNNEYHELRSVFRKHIVTLLYIFVNYEIFRIHMLTLTDIVKFPLIFPNLKTLVWKMKAPHTVPNDLSACVSLCNDGFAWLHLCRLVCFRTLITLKHAGVLEVYFIKHAYGFYISSRLLFLCLMALLMFFYSFISQNMTLYETDPHTSQSVLSTYVRFCLCVHVCPPPANSPLSPRFTHTAVRLTR